MTDLDLCFQKKTYEPDRERRDGREEAEQEKTVRRREGPEEKGQRVSRPPPQLPQPSPPPSPACLATGGQEGQDAR